MKHFIPFGVMAPDQSELDTPALRKVENMLPILGSMRPVKERVELSQYTTPNYPITGAHSILVTQEEPSYLVQPTADKDANTPKHILTFPRGNEDRFAQLDGEEPDDGNGVTMNPLTYQGNPQTARSTRFQMGYPGQDPPSATNLVFFARYFYNLGQSQIDAGEVILTAQVRLIVKEDGVFKFEKVQVDGGPAPLEWHRIEYTPSAPEFASISDWTKVEVELQLDYINLLIDSDSGQQDGLPDEDILTIGWQDELGGAVDLWQKVSDLSGGSPVDSTYVEGPGMPLGSGPQQVAFKLEDLDYPVDLSAAVTVRWIVAGSISSNPVNLRIELMGGPMKPSQAFDPDLGKLTVYHSEEILVYPDQFGLPDGTTFVIDREDIEIIENWDSLYLRATFYRDDNPDDLTYVPKITHLELNVPHATYVAWTWMGIEWPTSLNLTPGDRVRVIAGVEDKLLEAKETGWVDRTRLSGAYGTGGDATKVSKGWNFTTWGDVMFATNYQDLPQKMDMGVDSEFSDIVDIVASPNAVVPKGRYVAVVSNLLNFYDVNPDSPNTSSIGTPYTDWWSEGGNPYSYQIFNITDLSTYKYLTDTDGQIMGAVGGETGVVFKRNSIYRQSYVGYPRVYGYDLISVQEGTPYPKSPVAHQNNIYFWGNGMLGVVEDYSYVRRISTGLVEKFLFDTEYEEFAIRQDVSSDERINDQVVVGAHDSHTGLIWWAYSLASDPDVYHKSAILILNPMDRRVAIITGPRIGNVAESLGINYIVSRKNSKSSVLSYSKGVYSFRYFEGDRLTLDRFTGSYTYTAGVESMTQSAESWPGIAPGGNATLNRVRPIFRGTPDSVVPNIEVTIQAGETPWMQGDNEDVDVVIQADANNDGWINTRPLNGGFFDFTTKVPPILGGSMKELMGLQLDYERSGGY